MGIFLKRRGIHGPGKYELPRGDDGKVRGQKENRDGACQKVRGMRSPYFRRHVQRQNQPDFVLFLRAVPDLSKQDIREEVALLLA